MYNHNKAQQSKTRVHISWDILYLADYIFALSSNEIYLPIGGFQSCFVLMTSFIMEDEISGNLAGLRVLSASPRSMSFISIITTTMQYQATPDSKVYGANMGPTWDRQDPCGPHVGPMSFAIWDSMCENGMLLYMCTKMCLVDMKYLVYIWWDDWWPLTCFKSFH